MGNAPFWEGNARTWTWIGAFPGGNVSFLVREAAHEDGAGLQVPFLGGPGEGPDIPCPAGAAAEGLVEG
jgi:hypothetical protein